MMAFCHVNIIWCPLFLLAGISAVSASGCAYPGPSEVDLFLPHEKYCNLFYRLDKCPVGLVYNPSKQLCDLPVNAKCGSRKILTTGDNEGGRTGGTQGGNNEGGGTEGTQGGNNEGGGTEGTQGGNNEGGGTEGTQGGNSEEEEEEYESGFSYIGGECPSTVICPQHRNLNLRTFMPHPTACNLFCSCIIGESSLYKCDPGLHFNPKKRLCQPPRRAGCSYDGSGVIEVNPVTIFPPISKIEIWRRPILVEGACRPKQNCPQHGDLLLPHEANCNLLCGCKDGKSILYRCPKGLHFNSVSEHCDFPNNSWCNSNRPEEIPVTDSSFPTPNPKEREEGTYLGGHCLTSKMCPLQNPSGSLVYVPHLTVCNLFCGCNGSNLDTYACHKGLHFNPKIQGCDTPVNAGCNPTPPHKVNPILSPNGTGNGDCSTFQPCPKNDPSDFTVYLPHETDCAFFCRCDHGIAMLQKCAKGLHFNPRKQSCDVPNNAICLTTTSVESNVNPTMKPGQGGRDKNNSSGTGNTGGGTVPGGTGTAVQQEFCPVEGSCLPGKTDYLPHQRSCVLFCECVNGTPRLRRCAVGLHFNPRSKQCEIPSRAQCQGECGKLEHRGVTTWSPSTCTSRLSRIGDTCSIKCAKGYQLRGSTVVTCTKQGWHDTSGLEIMPSCKAPEEVGKDIIDNVEEQAKGKTNFLFILDESLSLSEEEFDSEISFAKAIVSQFPLSINRTAGIITFSGSAAVDIHMTHTDSCKFYEATRSIIYAGGSTDILLALRLATQEITTYSRNTKTLVFLITDGKSETHPMVAATDIKKKGHVLFAIGVGEYDRKQLEPLASLGNDGVPLFFGLTNFKAFKKIAEYLHTVHGYGVKLNCQLPDIAV